MARIFGGLWIFGENSMNLGDLGSYARLDADITSCLGESKRQLGATCFFFISP